MRLTICFILGLTFLLCTSAKARSQTTGNFLSDTNNIVKIDRNCLADKNGKFLGLGITYMRALWLCKYDISQFENDLSFISSSGFNYIRILSMVAWEQQEIAPVSFTNRKHKVIRAWPDYWNVLAKCVDIAYDKYHIRTEITIFADAQDVMPEIQQRQNHLKQMLEFSSTRRHKIILLEIANEAWQNGFPGDNGIAELRQLGDYLASQTNILVAFSAPVEGDLNGLRKIYSSSLADIATWHSSRDIRSFENGWRPVRDSWGLVNALQIPLSNNEPIGPGSSVAQETDPNKLVAAAVFSYISNMPMYVFHSLAGVSGADFKKMAGIGCFKNMKSALPSDLPNWICNDGIEPNAPLTVFCDSEPNKYLTDENSHQGVIRNCGSVKGKEFICLPIGITRNGVRMQARKPMKIEIYNLLTGSHICQYELKQNENFRISEGFDTCLIKGKLN